MDSSHLSLSDEFARSTSELCVAAEGPRGTLVGGRSLRGRVVLSSGGGRVRSAGQALPVGVLIPPSASCAHYRLYLAIPGNQGPAFPTW